MKARKVRSKIADRILKKIPLKTSIFISLQMDDYDNWKNGEYLGDSYELIKHTRYLMKSVFKWIDNGMPGGRDMDLTRYLGKPKFKHDCENCKFLGHYKEHDLYFCDKEPTVIARYGDDGSEYMSGIVFATSDGVELLYEAKKRAIELDYYKNN